jgi:hypothetical protein
VIAGVVRDAKATLAADPDGRLQAYSRRRIWLAMGPPEVLPKVMTRPTQCRALLALFCAEKVLPIWQQKWPRRKTPPQLLAKAFDVVRTGTDPVSLKREADSMWTAGEDHAYQYGPCPDAEVLLALSRALNVAYHDESFSDEDTTHEERDPLPDPWSWDAAYIAAEAYAQHHAKTKDELASKRREFWLFYLDDALPRAVEESRLLGGQGP